MAQTGACTMFNDTLDARLASLERLLGEQLLLQRQQVELQEALLLAGSESRPNSVVGHSNEQESKLHTKPITERVELYQEAVGAGAIAAADSTRSDHTACASAASHEHDDLAAVERRRTQSHESATPHIGRVLEASALLFSKYDASQPFLEFTESRYGQNQLSKYDSGRFASIMSLRYLFCRGSALRSQQVALNLFLHMLLASVIGAIVVTSQADAEFMANHVTSLVGEVSSWVVFLLGPYLGILFGRWWTLRTECLGGFWGCCDDICMLLAARFKSSSHICTIIHRWMTAAWTLVELSFTRASPEEILAVMVAENMLTKSEAALLQHAKSPPQNVLGWILDVLYELVAQGQLQGEMRTFEEKIVNARGSIGYLFAHFDTQVSFDFVHLMSCLIHCSNILSALGLGLVSAIAWNANVQSGWITFLAHLVQHLVRCVFLQGMLVVIGNLSDPFGPHTCAMPLAQFYDVFRDESDSFLKDAKPTRELFKDKSAEFVHHETTGAFASEKTTTSGKTQATLMVTSVHSHGTTASRKKPRGESFGSNLDADRSASPRGRAESSGSNLDLDKSASPRGRVHFATVPSMDSWPKPPVDNSDKQHSMAI